MLTIPLVAVSLTSRVISKLAARKKQQGSNSKHKSKRRPLPKPLSSPGVMASLVLGGGGAAAPADAHVVVGGAGAAAPADAHVVVGGDAAGGSLFKAALRRFPSVKDAAGNILTDGYLDLMTLTLPAIGACERVRACARVRVRACECARALGGLRPTPRGPV
jgi:hypothetical protein